MKRKTQSLPLRLSRIGYWSHLFLQPLLLASRIWGGAEPGWKHGSMASSPPACLSVCDTACCSEHGDGQHGDCQGRRRAGEGAGEELWEVELAKGCWVEGEGERLPSCIGTRHLRILWCIRTNQLRITVLRWKTWLIFLFKIFLQSYKEALFLGNQRLNFFLSVLLTFFIPFGLFED